MNVSLPGASPIMTSLSKMKWVLVSLACAVLMTACATTPPQSPYPDRPSQENTEPQTQIPPVNPDPEPEEQEPEDTPEEQPELVTDSGLTPPHMKGRDIKRVALLLPFSASNPRLAEEASAMLQGAELAVFQRPSSDVLLITFDTAGTQSGASSAAQAAINAGADVIIGPLLAPNVRTVNAQARRSRIPVIGFSTDQSVAGNGVFLLSFPPEAEVDRIVSFARSQGSRNFALLGPNNGYVRRVDPAYARAIEKVGGNYVNKRTYANADINEMQGPARELAREHNSGAKRFDAVLLPEGGVALRTLGPLLPYYDVNPSRVSFLGTGLWDRPETLLEPALRGGIFAGPDRDARARYESDFEISYGNEATRLSSLAYDGVGIAAMAATGDPKRIYDRLSDPRGFYGADGFVRFRKDGTPERGLAIYEVRSGEFRLIEPAPRSAEDIVN